ncbi:7:8-dihydro-8-oxoguanine triphosphatase-like protein, partial [Leptotrombidium deliense]
MSTHPFKQSKLYTLVFVVKGEKVLLGLKKRGFAKGKYNGFGGKLESNETLIECAQRELKEEANIEATNLKELGYIEFDYDSLEYSMKVYIYLATDFNGIPKSSDEMEPKWFHVNAIPYELMLSDTQHWLPKVLQSQFLNGYFRYNNENQIVEQKFHMISD